MKWQRNPRSVDFGIYAYKRKNTETPSLVRVGIEEGVPTDTRGWWLGPLNLPSQDSMSKMDCVCKNCKCWLRTGTSPHGRCCCFPPVDNNWSKTSELDFCYEFRPRLL